MAQPIGVTPFQKKNTKRSRKNRTNASTMRGNPFFRGDTEMPSRNTSVISARVKDETAVKLGELAEDKGITIARLIDDMVADFEKKETQTGVDPIGYAVSDDLDTPFGQKVDRKLEKLIERGYPENFIYSMKEQILNGLDAQIDMLPKRFDARKMKNNDCGC
jgi:hypothetical protein